MKTTFHTNKKISNVHSLKMEVIDCGLQGNFGDFYLEFWEMWLVCVITCNAFLLKSQNLHQIYILGFSQLVLKMGVIDIDLQGPLAISTQYSKKLHSTFILYTELGWPMGVTHPNVLLFIITKMHDVMTFANILRNFKIHIPFVKAKKPLFVCVISSRSCIHMLKGVPMILIWIMLLPLHIISMFFSIFRWVYWNMWLENNMNR